MEKERVMDKWAAEQLRLQFVKYCNKNVPFTPGQLENPSAQACSMKRKCQTYLDKCFICYWR